MKITKEMGYACLTVLAMYGEDYDGLAYGYGRSVARALRELGYGNLCYPADGSWYSGCDWKQPATALAMCAAIAGVKP